MHEGIKAILDQQRREQIKARKDLAAFVTEPTDVQAAILDLARRFQDIDAGQLIDLLMPWFPKYEVGAAIETLVFNRKLIENPRREWLRVSAA